VSEREGVLKRRATAGPALYYVGAAPERRPEAVVGLLHGYADHARRYAHVMDAWAERGIESVAIDMRGHGRAEGKRGHCERFAEYLDDARELEALVMERDAPAFLFGHSFGGLVASLFAMERATSFRGLVLSAPYLGLAREVPSVKLAAGRIASRVLPGLGFAMGLTGASVTHDAERARAYDEDPLVFSNATARWFVETQAAQQRATKQAPSLRMPLYVTMGTGDPVAKLESARAFFDAAGSADKTWDAREGLFHEVLSEPEWRSVADGIAEWVLARK